MNKNMNDYQKKAYFLSFSRRNLEEKRIILKNLALNRPIKEIAEIFKIKEIDKTAEKIRAWEKDNINTITFDSNLYPQEFKLIADPPLVIFTKGDINYLLSKTKVSVVGSRKTCAQYREIAESFSKELAASGVHIVSGLAIGIDSCAHMGALSSNLISPTTAILAHGLDTVYPRTNRNLAKQILDSNGLLISQFEPGTKPLPYNFLNRNRLIAALGIGTIVIQAGLKSGALNTARHALEYGKEIIALPGNALSPLYAGTNQLIKEGAYSVTNLNEILNILNLEKVKKTKQKNTFKKLGDIEINILDKLKSGEELHMLELFNSKLSHGRMHEIIFNITLSKLIQKTSSNKYIITKKGFEQLNYT